MDLTLNLDKYESALRRVHLTKDSGKVTDVSETIIKGYLPGAGLGSLVAVFPRNGEKSVQGEVVGIHDRNILIMPLGNMRGIGLGARIELLRQIATIRVGDDLLGRIINGQGEPIDGRGKMENLREVGLYRDVTNPLEREPIREPINLGVRAINSLLTVGRGQRVSILAGSGVGKSVLLGMMARYTSADVNVIAMIGERGREVREFIENELGEEGMKKSVIVAATGDENALVRTRGAYIATTIAEYFCDQGKDVLLMMDSVTRFCMAQREIGLSSGEPPATKGYTPSVFSSIPKLLERPGKFKHGGSITGIYTVLVEGDDMDDPIADSVRSVVDGHIVLSRKLAQSGHFPAIDILQSGSRLMKMCTDTDQQLAASQFRKLLAIYKESEDLINLGAYQKGASQDIDLAIDYYPHLNQFLQQMVEDPVSYEDSVNALKVMFSIGGPPPEDAGEPVPAEESVGGTDEV